MAATVSSPSCLVTPAASPLFIFHPTATTEIYTLSLHDALPIYHLTSPNTPRTASGSGGCACHPPRPGGTRPRRGRGRDRKSTRLNSSHVEISYAVFCLKKKKKDSRRAGRRGVGRPSPRRRTPRR